MGTSILETAMIALGGGILGGVGGWLVHAVISRRRIVQVCTAAQAKLDDVTTQRDRLGNKYSRSRARIESLQAANAKRSAHASYRT